MCKVVLDFLQISYPCIFHIFENINLSFWPKSFSSSKYIFRNLSFLRLKVVSTARHFWAQPEWQQAALLMEKRRMEEGRVVAENEHLDQAEASRNGRGATATQVSFSVPQPLAWIGSGWADKCWVQIGLLEPWFRALMPCESFLKGSCWGHGTRGILHRENETNKLSKPRVIKLVFRELLSIKLGPKCLHSCNRRDDCMSQLHFGNGHMT